MSHLPACPTCGGAEHTTDACPGPPKMVTWDPRKMSYADLKAAMEESDRRLLRKLRAHPRCVEYVRGYESHARAMAVTRSEDHRSDGEFCGLLAALLRGEG